MLETFRTTSPGGAARMSGFKDELLQTLIHQSAPFVGFVARRGAKKRTFLLSLTVQPRQDWTGIDLEKCRCLRLRCTVRGALSASSARPSPWPLTRSLRACPAR